MNSIEQLKSHVVEYPNFPKEGILYRDITPLLTDKINYAALLYELWLKTRVFENVEAYVGLESRGFALAGALANQIGTGFVPIRKAGKTPGAVMQKSYELEYGFATLEVQLQSIKKDRNYVIVDDLLATGGTARAAERLITGLGGNVLGHIFVAEIAELNGRSQLSGNVQSLLVY